MVSIMKKQNIISCLLHTVNKETSTTKIVVHHYNTSHTIHHHTTTKAQIPDFISLQTLAAKLNVKQNSSQ